MSRFYVSDLDGTLLNELGQLSAESRTLLTALLEDGLTFTVASARSVASIRPILHGLPLRLPVIEFNGAFITDLATGQHWNVNDMQREVVESVFSLIVRHRQSPFVSSFDGKQDRLYYRDIINPGMRNYLDQRISMRDPRLCSTTRLEDAFGEQVVSLTVIGEAAPLAALQSEILELHAESVETHFFEDLYFPGWPWLTVHDKRASKDQAIRLLATEHGLDSHELVVFGDQINDAGMFRTADRSIAVANAIADLKREASHVIGHHAEHAVARFIHQDWLGQGSSICGH